MTAENSGKILLLLGIQDAQTAEQLGKVSGLSLQELVLPLQHLIDYGFIIAGTAEGSDLAVFRLNPKGVRTEASDPHHRILLVDDDAPLRRLLIRLLAGEGYATIVAAMPGDGEALLNEVAFDLVLTDGFSATPNGVVVATAGLLASAGTTPVALFTAHRLDLDHVLAAGFRDLITKPFDIDEALDNIRTLLDSPAPRSDVADDRSDVLVP
jgi:CheY-like chemotaxis protein